MQTVIVPDSPSALAAENAHLKQQIQDLQTALAAGIAELVPLQPHQRHRQWRRTINRLCALAGRPRMYQIDRDQTHHPRRERQRQYTQAVGGRL